MAYTPLESRLIHYLSRLQTEDKFRSFRLQAGLVDFCSNDYLGFAKRPLAEYLDCIPGLADIPSGSGGARLLSGNSEYLHQLEGYINFFFHSESSLLFNSGFEANVGLLASLPSRHDTIYYDAESHASIKEGCRLSQAKAFSFQHNDLTDLERQLSQHTQGEAFVVIESVYSMSGSLALLTEISNLCKKFNAYLIVDEAHAVGVLGERGEGAVCAAHLEADICARVVTFGKAVGSNGAAILSSKIIRDYLINTCRNSIYTTAMPAWQAAKIQFVLECMYSQPQLLQQLHSRIRRFIYNIRTEYQTETHAQVPIQIVPIPGNTACKLAAQYLNSQGFDVRAILSPTVPAGQERLRICIHAYNSQSEIDHLLQHLNTLNIP